MSLPSPQDLFGKMKNKRVRNEAVAKFLLMSEEEKLHWIKENRPELFVCQIAQKDGLPFCKECSEKDGS